MKILNLYSGLGGNRKLWSSEHQVTSVELDEGIASIYKKNFPQDELIIGDAHDFMLKNFSRFDFIWSSPPCPSHSRARYFGHKNTNPVYPDMKLYEEIIFLDHHFKGKWIVENVVPYYQPLIHPSVKLGRHLIWANFKISSNIQHQDQDIQGIKKSDFSMFDITELKTTQRLDKVMRNCVAPTTGEHILNCALNIIRKENINQMELF